ncbi:MAG TPA: S8 family serine peptidase [Gaiellaceae bacterium]|nr:S8 family serine peptidase [Gaiellaceae bacterium]
MPRLLSTAVLATLALVLVAPAAAQDFVPGELIVRFEVSADAADRTEALAHRRAALRANLALPDVALVRLQPGDSVGAAAAALERDADVAWATPNYLYRTLLTPNDPLFDEAWHLPKISAPAAWDTTAGSAAVTVAVVDTGFQQNHGDIAPNLWSNPGEVANGVDDDGNGKIDDLHGWNFVSSTASPDDDNGHGTHVGATAGARGDDGFGVPGVAWNAKLMPLKAGNSAGLFTASTIINAFTYACGEGARIINGSFGGSTFDSGIKAAIDGCPGAVFVVAAGNSGTNNDLAPKYPCSYDSPNLICVAATDQADQLASFSNYGPASVDLAAPGVDIVSAFPTNGWVAGSGTSASAPQVSGAAALLATHRSALTAVELRAALMNGVDKVAGLHGLVGVGGRLNVQSALTAPTTPPVVYIPPPAPSPAPVDNIAPTDPAISSTSHVVGVRSIDATVDVTWSGAHDFGSGVDGYSFTWDGSGTSVPDTTKDVEETTQQLTSARLAPGTYWFHIRTRDNAGNWSAGTHAGPFVIAAAATSQPARCKVPRVKGKTVAAAKTALKRAGCKLGPVKRVRSRVPKGRIVAQRPAAGRRVGKGTPVAVTVSRGRR